jgi:hypothetical protein
MNAAGSSSGLNEARRIADSRSMLRISVSVVVTLAALLISAPAARSQVLQSEPPQGSLPVGKRVLVDDGTCPSGEIKQVVGGDQLGIPRKRQCVPVRHR